MRDLNLRLHRSSRNGFTLVEALVAVTVTLIMMLALSKGFVMLSDSISQGRARLNLSDQLRGITSVLREDLEGMTAGGNALSEACRSGYLDYYEGPLSDYTATLVNYDSTQQNIEQKIPQSRYGDFDDIIAFTAKAKKGRWFYGEVPYPVVMGPIHMAAGLSTDFTADQWAQTVTVASDTAEIVYFTIPMGADSTVFVNSNGAFSFDNVYNTPTNNYILDAADTDGVPDRMLLCRRVLLVLPSLNMPAGTVIPAGAATLEPTLFHEFNSGTSRRAQLHAFALGAPGSPSVTNYRFGMQLPYQRCDLSVRRVADGDLTTPDPIAANSLSDLQDPRNRFAHTVLPNNLMGTADTTMPIWSLSAPIQLQSVALSANTVLASSALNWFGNSVAGNVNPEMGFLPPHFLRQRRVDPIVAGQTTTAEGNIRYEMAFSEVLATNCIAFDVRGYDATVPVLYHPGRDNLPDTYNTPADAANFGQSGSDDVALTPTDPGYAQAFDAVYTTTAVNVPFHVAKRGAFVDAGWPLTTRATAIYVNNNSPTLGRITTWSSQRASNVHPFLATSLSMTSPEDRYPTGLPAFSSQAIKSGRAIVDGNNRVRVYQPGFDSFTGRFEQDGYRQFNGICVHGQHQYRFASGRIPNDNSLTPVLPDPDADLGANGVDDIVNGNVFGGVDDLLEHDATPPVTSPMKAIQVIVRVEDKGASVIQQMAVTHELRLEN